MSAVPGAMAGYYVITAPFGPYPDLALKLGFVMIRAGIAIRSLLGQALVRRILDQRA